MLAWRIGATEPTEVLWGGGKVHAFGFAKDGSRVASVDAESVRIWRPRKAQRARFAPSEGNAGNVAFSPDGKLIAFGESQGGVYLVDVEEPERPVRLGKLASYVLDVAFSPDGRRLAAVSNDFVTALYRLNDRTVVKSVRLQGINPAWSDFPALEYTPDGKLLVVSGPDGRIQALHPETLELQRDFNRSEAYHSRI